jgi:LytS/YehU family sensor histidine kinase
MDSLVPPMTLQLLVENAVKHNAISKEKPLLVYISAQDNQKIMVSNTKTEVAKSASSFKIGLDNIIKRYSFFSKEKIVIRDEERFIVQLPVLKMVKPKLA